MLKVLLVVIVLAVATYSLVRIIERRGVAPIPKRPVRRPDVRPVGPDDDEEFLRDLDRRRRHPEDPEKPA